MHHADRFPRCCRIVFAVAVATPIAAEAVEVGKAAWMDGMATAVPTAFCVPSQYFRLCFDVSASECEQTSASATRVCLSKYESQIPPVLQQPQDGTRFGTLVGQCAGTAYEVALASKRIANAKCNDPAAWAR